MVVMEPEVVTPWLLVMILVFHPLARVLANMEGTGLLSGLIFFCSGFCDGLLVIFVEMMMGFLKTRDLES